MLNHVLIEEIYKYNGSSLNTQILANQAMNK